MAVRCFHDKTDNVCTMQGIGAATVLRNQPEGAVAAMGVAGLIRHKAEAEGEANLETATCAARPVGCGPQHLLILVRFDDQAY